MIKEEPKKDSRIFQMSAVFISSQLPIIDDHLQDLPEDDHR
jgi:hypothetical protein